MNRNVEARKKKDGHLDFGGKIAPNRKDRKKNVTNFRGSKGNGTEIKRTEKMHNTLEDRKKNAPNFRGRKGKRTEP